ncbi:MAG TPA: hypothetical protein VH500_07550 [Nitrososphaeraceae archaeon]|jgi:hypothetical protein
MLGEQFGEVKGKITGQRVVDLAGPSIETSITASGSLKGVQIKETLTFIGRPTNSNGILHGKGIGVIMAGESELATVTGEGIGRIDSLKSVNYRGSLFFSTSSAGKLASLNNLVGVFEAVIDAEGNFTEKTWEWK